ncbi:carbonic anhydrase [Altericista sp. CCNU0014]|uniref:carbonic anhydrase n=1 Tax=Altericista sp. CCNU0014 TaxID=3082949 RepID=UPI00384FBD6D
MTHSSLKSNVSRRRMLQFGAGAVGASVATATLGQAIAPTAPAIAQNNITPDQALRQLIDGNTRFVAQKRKSPNQDVVRLNEVAKGQKPFAAILGCADSRVPSELVFDQGLGDLFVCRIAGNIAIAEEIGSLEFGAAVLGTKVIMVMGHERCGAVDAALKGTPVPGQIGSLLDAIKPCLPKAKNLPGDPLENACKANITYQVEKLKASPVLAELITAGKLKIVGGYYDLDTGKVSLVG